MRKDLFEELVASVEEAGAVVRGKAKAHRLTRSEDIGAEVRALRGHFKLSQPKFAALLGISVATLQNWEQGRRCPEGPAKVLLEVAAKHPDVLLSVAGQRRRRAGQHAAA
jgi:putative transcriptional regulator